MTNAVLCGSNEHPVSATFTVCFSFICPLSPMLEENTLSSWRASCAQDSVPDRWYQYGYECCQWNLGGVYLLLGYLPVMSRSSGHVVDLQPPGHWAEWKQTLTPNCHCLSLTSTWLSGDRLGKSFSLLQIAEDCSAVCFLLSFHQHAALSYKTE